MAGYCDWKGRRDTYNPEAAQVRDIYLVEKLGTKECCASGRRPQSDADVARDTVATLYACYVSAARSGQEIPVPARG